MYAEVRPPLKLMHVGPVILNGSIESFCDAVKIGGKWAPVYSEA
jgi:hypothetical protein